MKSNKIIYFLVLVLASLSYSISYAGNKPDCLTDGSSANPINLPLEGGCKSTPDFFQVSIQEIGVCNGIDAAVTLSTPLPDYHNKALCSAIYNASAPGTQVTINSSLSSTQLSGNITAPPSATYSYSYVIVDNNITSQLTKWFVGNYKGDMDLGPVPTGNANTVCWTDPGVVLINHVDANVSTKCGDAALIANPIARPMTIKMTNLECGAEAPYETPYHCHGKLFGSDGITILAEAQIYLLKDGSLPVWDAATPWPWPTGLGGQTSDDPTIIPPGYLSDTNQIIIFYKLDTPVVVSSTTSQATVNFSIKSGSSIGTKFPGVLDFGKGPVVFAEIKFQ